MMPRRKFTAACRNIVLVAFAGLFLSTIIFPVDDAQAKSRHKRHRHHAHAMVFRPQPASIIIDADTGRVMQSENADAQRYPASLTKMMTLYLAFEALQKGKLGLNDMIPVSERAASQPQTNIALAPGDRIAVKDAILSVVVRSANDSAVALAEALGGSEEAFARKMTSKARALGMTHTVFYNASGLPEPRQRTTARDMATLGLALRKHFPQYYPFFRTESFSFRGTTYVTHNHVMERYDGVDGIKTGYIRASGYNLVTSAMRGNHRIVAVVLGGSSYRARDDKMIALLDHSFADLASSPANHIQVAYASGRRISAFPYKSELSDESSEGEGDRPGDTIDAQRARQSLPQFTSLAGGDWGVQVGTFMRDHDAEAAANHAVTQAPAELKGSTVSITRDANSTHRARLVGITQAQAESACQRLASEHLPCFAYRQN